MENKIFYTHGVYKYDPLSTKEEIFVRNTEKYEFGKRVIPLPLKLQDVLREKWIKWFYVNKTLTWYNKTLFITSILDGKIEFTIAECPDEHTIVIAICHPYYDQFKRKTGISIVKDRIIWALSHPDEDRTWSYRLRK